MKDKIIKLEQVTYRYPVYQDDENTNDTPERETGSRNNGSESAQDQTGDNCALNQVDLEVEKGQFICILGSNGSGKSTLARHLNALLTPDSGTVWIDGMDSRDGEQIWNIRSLIGMVFQNPDNQMVAAQVDEEIAFGPENMGVPSETIAERVQEALRMTGMEGFEKKNPAYLSGGQKQRVAIAGVMAMRPECIVLDESTAMLDPQGRREIMDTVLRLNREHGITLICITHFMEDAIHADRIFVMHQGQVSIQGTPREVFARGEELAKAGLMLPVICTIAGGLRQKGIPVPDGIITEEELLDYLKELPGIR